jgi:hypothetical protein
VPFVDMKVSWTIDPDDAEGWVSQHLLARSGASRTSSRSAGHLVGVADGVAEARFLANRWLPMNDASRLAGVGSFVRVSFKSVVGWSASRIGRH